MNILKWISFFSAFSVKVDHIFPGVSGSLFFWRMDQFFLDNRSVFRKDHSGQRAGNNAINRCFAKVWRLVKKRRQRLLIGLEEDTYSHVLPGLQEAVATKLDELLGTPGRQRIGNDNEK